jgi:hypothetical protein
MVPLKVIERIDTFQALIQLAKSLAGSVRSGDRSGVQSTATSCSGCTACSSLRSAMPAAILPTCADTVNCSTVDVQHCARAVPRAVFPRGTIPNNIQYTLKDSNFRHSASKASDDACQSVTQSRNGAEVSGNAVCLSRMQSTFGSVESGCGKPAGSISEGAAGRIRKALACIDAGDVAGARAVLLALLGGES